jgi:putative transposase
LDECAAAYRKFCQKYRPKPKSESKNHWGSRLLVGLKVKGKSKKVSPGQMCLPWGEWLVENPEILAVAEKFILANCYNPQVAGQILQQTTVRGPQTDDSQCQVSET